MRIVVRERNVSSFKNIIYSHFGPRGKVKWEGAVVVKRIQLGIALGKWWVFCFMGEGRVDLNTLPLYDWSSSHTAAQAMENAP